MRYFVWNFKVYPWNSTQNILPIHWKIQIYSQAKIYELLDLRAHTCFWNDPLGHYPFSKQILNYSVPCHYRPKRLCLQFDPTENCLLLSTSSGSSTYIQDSKVMLVFADIMASNGTKPSVGTVLKTKQDMIFFRIPRHLFRLETHNKITCTLKQSVRYSMYSNCCVIHLNLFYCVSPM